MSEQHHTHGRFIWRDLSTSDVEASTAFYTELFGWKYEDRDMGGGSYRILKAGDREVGGMMQSRQEGTPPFWMGHVSCADVEAATRATEQAGGKVLVPPTDMQIGFYALVQDNQGAVIGFYHSKSGDPEREGRPSVGEFCWESLHVKDPDAAAGFYRQVLGWGRAQGAGSEVFAIGAGMENMVATLARAPDGVPAHWLTFVLVDELHAARDRATRLGGKVLLEEVPVPGLGRFAIFQGPQGEAIAAFEGTDG